jgi:hypothetical protein
LDDIYWSVIDKLSTKFSDRKEIDEMKNFLIEEGYKFKRIDISNGIKMISEINKCDVGIIHQPIKNTLLGYFNSMSVSKSFSIKAFYTNNFARVWEVLVRLALKDTSNNTESLQFREKLKSKFERKETRRKRFFDESELNEFIEIDKSIKVVSIEKIGRSFRLTYDIDVKSIPDVFSSFDGKEFIGDAKYYQDPENADFEKEFKTYNTITENEYPMVVFVPSFRTRVLHTRIEDDYELIILHLSTEQAIKDATENTNDTINKVQELISKETSRDFVN